MSRGRIATTGVMLAIFSGMSLLALGFPEKAAFTPLLIGIPGAILCAVQLAIDLKAQTSAAVPDSGEAPADRDADTMSRREWSMFLWLAIFTVTIIGLGFHIGGTLVVFLYIRFGEGEPWRNAVIAGVGTFLVIWLIFTKLLELPLFSGLLLPTLF